MVATLPPSLLRLAATSSLLLAGQALADPSPVAPQTRPLPVSEFKRIDRDSGRDHYYKLGSDSGTPILSADYLPPMQTETFGTQVPDGWKKIPEKLHWRWRVRTFPVGGDDCGSNQADSAAGVFLTFKSGLKWVLLKYIWSETRPVGMACDHRRSPFYARDTLVLETGGPLGTWRDEVVDPRAAYAAHFGGKPEDAPDLVGVGIFTDGDQTKTPSAADYAAFSLEATGKK